MPMDRQPHQRFELGEWQVQADCNRLYNGSSEVKLEAKAMAILCYLAQNEGQVVTRHTLEEEIWGNTVVGYDALTAGIAKLRRALNDDPRNPKYIETIPKKGYRLICSVIPSANLEEEQQNNVVSKEIARSRWPGFIPTFARWGVGLVVLFASFAYLLVLPSPIESTPPRGMDDLLTISILPFVNASPSAGDEALGYGLSVDLTTALSKLSGLRVITSDHTVSMDQPTPPLKQLAKSLGVQYVLLGSIRREGARLRVNAHLLDSEKETYLWSEKFDRDVSNLFDIQDDVTERVLRALAVTLNAEESRRVAAKMTTDLPAYEDFQKGVKHYDQYTNRDNQLAREWFHKAIDKDRYFAYAYSMIGLTYANDYRFAWNVDANDTMKEALQWIEKGIALDPELAKSHWAKAHAFIIQGQYHQALQSAKRAIEIDPNFADAYIALAIAKLYTGSETQALRLVKNAMALRPLYPAAYASVLGQVYFHRGEYALAIVAMEDAIERNNNLKLPYLIAMASAKALGDTEQARWYAILFRDVNPNLKSQRLVEWLSKNSAAVSIDFWDILVDPSATL